MAVQLFIGIVAPLEMYRKYLAAMEHTLKHLRSDLTGLLRCEPDVRIAAKYAQI